VLVTSAFEARRAVRAILGKRNELGSVNCAATIEEFFDGTEFVVADIGLRMLEPRAEGKNITLSSYLPHRPLRLWGDRQKLKQVLLNLLSNAVKFTPPGGHVRVAALVGDDGAPLLVVEDDGIGIAAQDIEKVLLPFERVHSQMSLAAEGTGIGLPLSKSFVESHGGTLTLDSTLGRGTTVTVRLPPQRLRFYGSALAMESFSLPAAE